MTFGLRRNHPGAKLLRILTVDVDSLDAVVHFVAVVELELALQVDLNKRSRVGLLGLEQGGPVVASRGFTVEQLVDGVPQHAGKASAVGIQLDQVLVYQHQFRIITNTRYRSRRFEKCHLLPFVALCGWLPSLTAGGGCRVPTETSCCHEDVLGAAVVLRLKAKELSCCADGRPRWDEGEDQVIFEESATPSDAAARPGAQKAMARVGCLLKTSVGRSGFVWPARASCGGPWRVFRRGERRHRGSMVSLSSGSTCTALLVALQPPRSRRGRSAGDDHPPAATLPAGFTATALKNV